jgi:hypothetical protein
LNGDCPLSLLLCTGTIYDLKSYPPPNFVVKLLSLLVKVEQNLIEVAAVIKVSVTSPKSREYQDKKANIPHGVPPYDFPILAWPPDVANQTQL